MKHDCFVFIFRFIKDNLMGLHSKINCLTIKKREKEPSNGPPDIPPWKHQSQTCIFKLYQPLSPSFLPNRW